MPTPVTINLSARHVDHLNFVAAGELSRKAAKLIEEALGRSLPPPDSDEKVRLRQHTRRGDGYEVTHLDFQVKSFRKKKALIAAGLVHPLEEAPTKEVDGRPDRLLRALGEGLGQPFFVTAEVEFNFPDDAYRSVFPLPIELPPQMKGSEFDEIRGVRLMKRGSGSAPFDHTVILDLPSSKWLDLTVRVNVPEMPFSATIFRRVLDRADQIARQVVEPVPDSDTLTTKDSR